MAGRKDNPGRINLTLKKAKELAKRELGTAKGLAAESGMKNYYCMELGNLVIRICPEYRAGGHIAMAARWASGIKETIQLFNPETLEKDFRAEEVLYTKERQEQLECWVLDHAPDYCHGKIDEVWSAANNETSW